MKTDFHYYFNTGNIFAGNGMYDYAVRMYKNALGYSPNSGFIYALTGMCQFEMGHYAEAVHEYEKALQLMSPDIPYIHNNIGRASYLLGNYSNAIKEYNRASIDSRMKTIARWNKRVAGLSSRNIFYRMFYDVMGWTDGIEKTPDDEDAERTEVEPDYIDLNYAKLGRDLLSHEIGYEEARNAFPELFEENISGTIRKGSLHEALNVVFNYEYVQAFCCVYHAGIAENAELAGALRKTGDEKIETARGLASFMSAKDMETVIIEEKITVKNNRNEIMVFHLENHLTAIDYLMKSIGKPEDNNAREMLKKILALEEEQKARVDALLKKYGR